MGEHGGHRDGSGSRLPRPGRLAVFAVMAAAGLLFATSAQLARGTTLRSESADLASLIESRNAELARRQAELADLRAESEEEAAVLNRGNGAARSLQRRSAALESAAGLTSVTGPGLVVSLDDAPRGAPVPASATPDDLVVHQQDVQAVVNALWAGGAEAMMLMDQRVISTSAVRCVGNTLILQGRVYSPPYRIRAIGDPTRLRAALDASPDVQYLLQYVAAMSLGYDVQERSAMGIGEYEGPLRLGHAAVPGSEATTAAATTTTEETP